MVTRSACTISNLEAHRFVRRFLLFYAESTVGDGFETIDESIVLRTGRGLSHGYLELSIAPDIVAGWSNVRNNIRVL